MRLEKRGRPRHVAQPTEPRTAYDARQGRDRDECSSGGLETSGGETWLGVTIPGRGLDARTKLIHRLHEAGASLSAVGRRHGLSRSRVRQLLAGAQPPTASHEESMPRDREAPSHELAGSSQAVETSSTPAVQRPPHEVPPARDESHSAPPGTAAAPQGVAQGMSRGDTREDPTRSIPADRRTPEPGAHRTLTEDDRSILAMRVADLPLSRRTTNGLRRADLQTLAEIVIRPRSALCAIPNMGPKSLAELEEFLATHGLRLSMDPDQVRQCTRNDGDVEPAPRAGALAPEEAVDEPESREAEGTPGDISIETSGLSVRAANALLRHGLRTLSEVSRLELAELRAIPNLGSKTLSDIVDTLRANGLAPPRPSGWVDRPPTYARAPREDQALRNTEIVKLREQGMTLQEIALGIGVSRERIRQILERTSIRPKVTATARADRHLSDAERVRDDLVAGYRAGRGTGDLARQLKVSRTAADRVIASSITAADRVERRRALSRTNQTYSRDELIHAVRRVAELIDDVPSAKAYGDRARELGLPSDQTVANRFGGWANAVRAAGMTPRPSNRKSYSRRWTEEACWAALAGLLAELGEAPTAEQYDVLASASDDLPSLGTVRNRLGRWSEVVARLVAIPHAHPTLRRLGLSQEVGPGERDQAIWLAHLEGDVTEGEMAELLGADLFDWHPSYGPRPDL